MSEDLEMNLETIIRNLEHINSYRAYLLTDEECEALIQACRRLRKELQNG